MTAVLTRSNNEVKDFYHSIKCFYMMDDPVDSRRKSERLEITMPVCVSHHGIDGQAVHHQAISRDLSEFGIGLVMSNPIGRELVLLTIQPSDGSVFDVLARVVHSQEIGFYFHVGLEFVVE